MTLRELQKRINNIVATLEAEGRGERLDLPVHVSVRVTPRRNIYVPLEYVSGAELGYKDADGNEVRCIEAHADGKRKTTKKA
jgi:hypothetical protein